MLNLTQFEFEAEIKKQILLDNLDPCNGLDFGFTIASEPCVYWFCDGSRVGEINYSSGINVIYKFGISWQDVLVYRGKTSPDELSRNEVKKAMIDILEETNCAKEWFNELALIDTK